MREVIVRRLPDGEPRRDDVAGELCMSERTLQRRLETEATTFLQLLDDTRRELAEQYLGRLNLSLAQAAYLLGFADQTQLLPRLQALVQAFARSISKPAAPARARTQLKGSQRRIGPECRFLRLIDIGTYGGGRRFAARSGGLLIAAVCLESDAKRKCRTHAQNDVVDPFLLRAAALRRPVMCARIATLKFWYLRL